MVRTDTAVVQSGPHVDSVHVRAVIITKAVLIYG